MMSVDSSNPSPDLQNEDRLAAAVKARASYIRTHLQSMTLASVRRLLEDDLGLEKLALDNRKSLIKKFVDEVLTELDGPETSSQEEKDATTEVCSSNDTANQSRELTNTVKKESRSSPNKEQKPEADDARSSDEILEDLEEQEFSDEAPKKRKKVKKLKNIISDDSGSEHNLVETSENDIGNSSQKKKHKGQGKKIVDTKPIQSKYVEHLKKVIKAVGLGIPPSIYKKVKQASEKQQEAILTQELEAILEREGLSSNPSDKEIKACKRRRERAKDLEGIDKTNIILEPRKRRADPWFIPPPKYVKPVEEDTNEEKSDSPKNGKHSPKHGLSSGEEGSE